MAALAVLVTALVTALVTFLAARRKHRQDDIDDAVKRYQKLLDLNTAHIVDLTDELEEVRQEHTDCQVSLEAIYVWAQHSDMTCKALLKKLGLESEIQLPPLPARPARRARSQASEFRQRTMAQNAQLLQQQTTGTIPPPPPIGNES